jgi:putative ABC transport system permease protein
LNLFRISDFEFRISGFAGLEERPLTFFKWVIRSLVHYRRMHLAVALAAATATATLTGALVVGDSVRATLRYVLDARLGSVHWAVSTQERFFNEELSQRLSKTVGDSAPVLQMRGMVSRGDGSVRVNKIHILGVDDRFFKLSLAGKTPAGFGDGNALINAALAERLSTRSGQAAEVIVRIDKPGALSRDLVIAPVADNTIAMRLPVSAVADDEHFGRFSLEANQQDPLNIFVPRSWLQGQLEREGQANLLLIKNPPGGMTEDALKQALNSEWRLADAEAVLQTVEGRQSLELRTSRVFLDHALSSAALKAYPEALPVLTYFVNELRVGNAATPYSMVTAADRKGSFVDILPADMKDDQIVINQWLADDLHAHVGDVLKLTYYLPSGGQSLEEGRRSFRICRVVPLQGTAADSSLMPDFPGLTDAENCSDWDSGLPISLNLIRDKDEAYWDNYRGTPKAFVTLSAGQAMWANRYGDLTAVRFPVVPSENDTLEENLRQLVDPASLGLSAMPVRDIGTRAISGGTDLGLLFLGLSMFLIAAAILLTCLLFVFSVENRRVQTGMLLAIGFPARRIQRLYLLEGCLVALLGAAGGACLGLVYPRLLILGLSTAWQGAVAGTAIRYSASLASLGSGFFSGFLISLVAMAWTLHRQMKDSAHSLLSGSESSAALKPYIVKRRWVWWAVSMLSLAGAFLLIMISMSSGSGAMAGAFFGAGALLLVSVMIWIGMALHWLGARHHRPLHSLPSLALRSSARRWGRSMAVVAILACGVFMVVAVSANRKDLSTGASLRSSGTGGFALYAESSVPIVKDLNSDAGHEAWGLKDDLLNETRFVSMRVRDGDDASCLNLNRAQEPRILGLQVDSLTERKAFTFRVQKEDGSSWDLLRQDLGNGVIPAVGDYPTVYWGLGRKIGDDLIYHNRKGEEVRLRIVGMITSSILQGNLVISEAAMQRYFPEVEGYRAWMIDTTFPAQAQVSEHLTLRLADAGFSVETAADRLKSFGQVENTYLSIFLVLGGLGLVLGCAGLGLIVVRNLLERQGELAMLRAVGFNRLGLMKMVCLEHVFLLGAGLLTGMGCALVAVAPTLRAASGQLPFGLLAILMLMICSSGVIWVLIAARFALRGTILTPLRNE